MKCDGTTASYSRGGCSSHAEVTAPFVGPDLRLLMVGTGSGVQMEGNGCTMNPYNVWTNGTLPFFTRYGSKDESVVMISLGERIGHDE